jgi:hypothetical protein
MMVGKHISPRPSSQKIAAHIDVYVDQGSVDALFKQSKPLPVLDWKFSVAAFSSSPGKSDFSPLPSHSGILG